MKNEKKLSLDDILSDTKPAVQTFKNAEKKAKILKKIEAEKKEVGRPPVAEKDKAKKRILYYSDAEFEEIEKMAKLYEMKPMKWIKMVIKKELNRERIL